MNKQQRKLDQQLADYTDQIEMGLDVDDESFDPEIQELVSTVQLIAKGLSVKMPDANTQIRLKNRISAAYLEEFKENTSLQAHDNHNPLKHFLSNLKVWPLLQFSLIVTVFTAVFFLLPIINFDSSGLTGTASSDQNQVIVLAVVFLVAAFVFWLINRKPK